MNVKELQFTLKIHLKLRHDTYQLLRWSRVVFRILNMCHARISFYGSITALLWLYYGSITVREACGADIRVLYGRYGGSPLRCSLS